MHLDKRNIILILIIVFIALISWQFTIKNTFQYKQELEVINLESLRDKQVELERLVTRKKIIEKALEENEVLRIGVRELIFELYKDKESIQILNFNDDITVNQEGFETKYFQIEAKGNYDDLILLVDEILLKCPNVILISYSMEHHKSNYKNKEFLSLSLVVSVKV